MRAARLAGVALVALAVGTGRVARAGGAIEITIDHDDVDVTTDVVVKPGHYVVEDKNGDGVLRVKADGVEVILKDVVLIGAPEGRDPDAFEGVGVNVEGHSDVEIRHGAVRGFRVGVRGSGSKGLALEDVDASRCRAMRLKSTPEREDESDWLWPHENDDGQWEKNYGAGISLTSCPEAHLRWCQAHRGQNGLLLTRCDEARVESCDFSFNSGWGIAMYRSSKCRIEHDRCDWCVRGYSHGVYARGQDSAGILVFEQCSHNHFVRNSATHSGDGFFLYAGNETLEKTGKGGCNGNMVLANDFSHAVANGIEATFSEANSFDQNRLDDCDHGIWAGYSRNSIFAGNFVEGCANGVSIEHGHHNWITRNSLKDCRTGIHLWWDPDPDLTGGVYGKAQDTSSSDSRIEDNWIRGGDVAFLLDSDTGGRIERNRIDGARHAMELRGRATLSRCAGNAVSGPPGPSGPLPATVVCETDKPVQIGSNWWAPVSGADAVLFAGAQKVLPGPPLAEEPRFDRLEGWSGRSGFDGYAFLPDDAPRGRKYIFVDEWGPLDPRLPQVFPAKQTASGAAHLHVLGAALPFTVEKLTDGFVAEPASGTTPAAVKIHKKDPSAGPSLAPFEATVKVGDKTIAASGSVLSAKWKVRFYEWKKDPREDAAAWKALVDGPALDTMDLDGLDFFWGGTAPSPKVPADRFGTVAETTLALPPGPYRIRATSDDGIRVMLDGKTILEDWTHHAPKEDTVQVAWPGGAHAIRVEHFEIDGWAALRFSISPGP